MVCSKRSRFSSAFRWILHVASSVLARINCLEAFDCCLLKIMKILKKWLKNTKNSWISWKWHQIKKWRNPNTAWHRSSPPWFDCLSACNLPTSCSHHYNKDRDELDHRKDEDDRRSLQTILSTKSHIPLSRIEEYKDLEVMAKSYHITAFYRGKIFFW